MSIEIDKVVDNAVVLDSDNRNDLSMFMIDNSISESHTYRMITLQEGFKIFFGNCHPHTCIPLHKQILVSLDVAVLFFNQNKIKRKLNIYKNTSFDL